MKKNKEDELQFVVDHYKTGHKNVDNAWKEFKGMSGITQSGSRKRLLVAASIAFAAVMAVAATMFVVRSIGNGSPKSSPNIERALPDTVSKAKTDSVKTKKGPVVFYFDHTPVNAAIRKVSDYYGVSLTASDTTKMVTGEIEAHNINEAIDMLETTLGIEITKR